MKGLTLRTTIRLFGLGVAVYVAIIAAVIAVRIAPTARALRVHSDRVRQEYEAINDRSTALHEIIDEIQQWIVTTDRPDRLQAAVVVRTRIDSLTGAAGVATQLSAIPTAMRVEFSRSTVEQSRAGTALLEALADLELGRTRDAERQLARADSMARLIDRHMATAQRLGLDDLIAREQALANAAGGSVRAIGWWAALGMVAAPFVLFFLRRRLYQPLTDLAEGIAQVKKGDLAWTIPVRRADELGRLTEHFNEATAILCQRAEETRQQAQAVLQQSEARYKAMVELAPVGVAVVDAAGKYLHVNPAMRRFLGYSEEELRGRTFRDVTAPGDRDEGDVLFEELREGKRDRYQIEKRYLRKDGTVVWARLSVGAVRDPRGALLHTVAMIEDVTDEKQRLAVARESEERLREEQAALVDLARHRAFTAGDVTAAWHELTEAAAATLRVARASVWLMDPSGTSLRCDDLYDLSRRRHSAGIRLDAATLPAYFSALREHRVIAASDAQHDARTRELDALYLAQLGITSVLDAPIRAGGTVLGVVRHEHIGPERQWTAAAQSFAGSIADLAALALEAGERARAETARRKSDEMFAVAFRMSPIPSVLARLDDGVLVDANDAYYEVTGFTRDEVIGKSAREVLWPDPRGRDEMVRRLRSGAKLRHMDLRMRTKAGHLLDVLVSVEVIEIDGVPHTLGSAIDITERNRVAEALRDSEERFRRLVQDLSIGVALLDGRGEVLHVNPAALEILGVTDEEVGVTGFWQRELSSLREDGTPYANEDRPILKAVRTGQRLHNLVAGVPPRGKRKEVRWLSANVEPQLNADGTVRTFIVWFADITERKRDAEALRASEAELRALVSAMSDVVLVLDADGRYLKIANTSPALLYRPAPELLGKTLHEVLPRAQADEFLAVIRRALGERRPQQLEYVLALGERDVWFSAVVNPLSEGSVVWVARDVTETHEHEIEQRRLQEAVMASAVDWTLTFDAVQSPIIVLSGEGRVRRMNAAGRALAGLPSPQAVANRTLAELGAHEPWAGLARLAQDVQRTRMPAAGQVQDASTPPRTWYLAASPITVPGEADRTIVLARDISDLVALQESLRRTETMSALGSLVAGVAHEVRNPLFGISATIDAFEARFRNEAGKERYSQTLRQEVDRLSKLMQDLLEYGKPPRLELVDTAVGPVVARAIAACSTIAESAGVTVIDAVPDVLPAVPIDPSRMQQVFQNLIENAIQHSPRGGNVTVSGALVSGPGAAHLEVSVADQGPGFRPEDLQRLYEPFFSRRRGGTGLGLSIVLRIVEQHGGDVVAANRPEGAGGGGSGALITVRLALAAEPARVEA